VHAPTGEIELSMVLTAQGPVFRVRGARLEIDSTNVVSVSCRTLELKAEGGIELHAGKDLGISSGGEVRVKSRGQTPALGDGGS
jgi:hypothetical protein